MVKTSFVFSNITHIHVSEMSEVQRIAHGLRELDFEPAHVLPHGVLLERGAYFVFVKVSGLNP